MAVKFFLLTACGALALIVAGAIGFVTGRSWERYGVVEKARKALPPQSPRLGRWSDVQIGYYVQLGDDWVQIADVSDADIHDPKYRAFIDTNGRVFEKTRSKRVVYRLPEVAGTGELSLLNSEVQENS